MKDKYLLRNYCIDYIPFNIMEKINVKEINEWAEFLYINKVFELKDIYTYLGNKLKQYEK